ncbi:MAG: hypothetical protein ACI4SF_14155 [Oscillospiraceae bacterium]
MGMEYRLNDVIEALSSDDPIKAFSDNQMLYWGLMNYCVNDRNSLIVRIKEEFDKEKTDCLFGLVEFFPMTCSILESLIIEDDILTDVLDKCRFADVLERSFNKFTNTIGSDARKINQEINDVADAIENYKDEINRHQEIIDNYKRNMASEKELHDKLLDKQKELRELEAEWGTEIINEKIRKAEDDIVKRNEEKKKAEKKLKELGRELNKTENCNDSEFIKRVKAFNEIIKELPKDVSES